jgi:urease accessory protein
MVTTMRMTTTTTKLMSDRASTVPGSSRLLKLMTFLSPAFPTGAFSYSHGLEWLIDNGSIRDAETLQHWLSDLLEVGSAWNDAVLFVEAYRSADAGAFDALLDVAVLAEALASSRERHLETMQQGRAFATAVSAAWPCEAMAALGRAGAALPVAVATAAAGHGIPLAQALPAYLNAFSANLVSVAVRLVPLGQTAGLKILAALHPAIAAVAERATASALDELGAAAVLSDVASMRHEEQYSRVFRT